MGSQNSEADQAPVALLVGEHLAAQS